MVAFQSPGPTEIFSSFEKKMQPTKYTKRTVDPILPFAGNGDLKGPIPMGDRGALVFRLLEKTPLEKAALDKEKETLRESLRRQKADRLIQALIQRRRSDLKVEVNREHPGALRRPGLKPSRSRILP